MHTQQRHKYVYKSHNSALSGIANPAVLGASPTGLSNTGGKGASPLQSGDGFFDAIAAAAAPHVMKWGIPKVKEFIANRDAKRDAQRDAERQAGSGLSGGKGASPLQDGGFIQFLGPLLGKLMGGGKATAEERAKMKSYGHGQKGGFFQFIPLITKMLGGKKMSEREHQKMKAYDQHGGFFQFIPLIAKMLGGKKSDIKKITQSQEGGFFQFIPLLSKLFGGRSYRAEPVPEKLRFATMEN